MFGVKNKAFAKGLFVCLFVCVFVCLFVRVFVCLFVGLFVCLFVVCVACGAWRALEEGGGRREWKYDSAHMCARMHASVCACPCPCAPARTRRSRRGVDCVVAPRSLLTPQLQAACPQQNRLLSLLCGELFACTRCGHSTALVRLSTRGGTRTRNLLLRREAPYPLGHTSI